MMPTAGLPAIPVIDARDGGPLAVAQAAQPQMDALFTRARHLYTPPVLALCDRLSRRWLEHAQNPYLREIDGIAAMLGATGAYALNTSYEWACTSGVAEAPDGGVHLLRVLDWILRGLGRNVVIVRQSGPAGDFLNLTWPGYIGVITALAPGRFALAINQPPIPAANRVFAPVTLPVDWLRARWRVWQSRALPPSHLARLVCEQCRDYGAAVEMLRTTPLALPAFFTVAGICAGEGCVIERNAGAAAMRQMPAAVANHWVALAEHGVSRGPKSRERQAQMETCLQRGTRGENLTAPILNRTTRMVAELNPRTGDRAVQGWEPEGPATARLTMRCRAA